MKIDHYKQHKDGLMAEKKLEGLAIRIPPGMLQEFKAYAQENNTTMSNILREDIAKKLKDR